MSSNPVKVIGSLFLLGITMFMIFVALKESPYAIPPVLVFLFELLVMGVGGAYVYSLANRN